MSVSVIVTGNFQRAAKRLIKKYRSLKGELQGLIEELESNPRTGVKIGDHTYKIRLAVKSKGKGKSGGVRIISYVDVEISLKEDEATVVYLLSIYDKSDREDIPDKLLKELVNDLEKSLEEE